MKHTLMLSALIAVSTATAAPLTQNLPAGALVTLETHNAASAFERLLGVVNSAASAIGFEDEADEMTDGVGPLLRETLGQEAVLGVFSVGTPAGGFSPELLAVSRVGEQTRPLVTAMVKGKGAAVGRFRFVRQKDMFVGTADDLVYLSTDKTLLMSYLARLSGRTAPRLGESAVYTAPSRAAGEQQLGLYLNFSAMAKMVRGALAKELVPRLFSPLVDALDTLGQYAAGFTTTEQGLEAQAAHVPNAQGKDTPLYAILTHTTDFQVQRLIPADAQSVQATACASESNGYVGRWLTRLDLVDPTGFLTDSQLASHLERSARYLGDECAQVTLAGNRLDQDGLSSTVTYQRVRDMAAAQAHLPEYVAALNTAIQALPDTLDSLAGAGSASLFKPAGAMSGSLQRSTEAQLGSLKQAVSQLKLVYAFRDGYLITAFSDQALKAALATDQPVLADDPAFQAAGLKMDGVGGWSYARRPGEVSDSDLEDLLRRSNDPQAAMVGALFAGGAADIINRYQGMSAQTTVNDGLILTKSSIGFTWE